MHFGLANAAQCMQTLVYQLIGIEFEGRVFCYIDDIVIVSATFEEHMYLLNRVYDKFKKANLTIN